MRPRVTVIVFDHSTKRQHALTGETAVVVVDDGQEVTAVTTDQADAGFLQDALTAVADYLTDPPSSVALSELN